VYDTRRRDDLSAEYLGDALVTEAHPEYGDIPRTADELLGDASVGRTSRPGGYDYPVGFHRESLVDSELIVTEYLHVGVKLPDILHDIVYKRIVIIDD
jgi:hypothetical protein